MQLYWFDQSKGCLWSCLLEGSTLGFNPFETLRHSQRCLRASITHVSIYNSGPPPAGQWALSGVMALSRVITPGFRYACLVAGLQWGPQEAGGRPWREGIVWSRPPLTGCT